VHCPRCGEQNEQGNRYCIACGAALATGAPSQREPFGERLRRLIGTSRRARLLTGGTAVAIVIAIAAFVALEPATDGGGRDAYTVAADGVCVEAKGEIATVLQRAATADPGRNPDEYARLVPIIAEWRSTLNDIAPPRDRRERAWELDAALRDVLVEAAALARVARGGRAKRLVAQAQRVDDASEPVEEAIDALALERCGRIDVGVAESR
jgi:hypothetical protein